MTPGRGRLAKLGIETTNNGGRAHKGRKEALGARQRAETAAERWVTADAERQVSGKQRGRLGVLDFLLFSTQAGAGDPALGSDKIADVVRAMRKRRELLLTGRRAGKFDTLPGGEDGIRGSVPPDWQAPVSSDVQANGRGKRHDARSCRGILSVVLQPRRRPRSSSVTLRVTGIQLRANDCRGSSSPFEPLSHHATRTLLNCHGSARSTLSGNSSPRP
jgi:hypothetical protein